MNNIQNNVKTTSLRKVFVKRLLLLLVVFSSLSTLFVAFNYQTRLDRQNVDELSALLNHIAPRLKNQEKLWQEDAEHVLDIIEWSGLIGLKEPVRAARLNSLFTAQSEHLGFEGVSIFEKSTGTLIYDYWGNSERPTLKSSAVAGHWLDEEHQILYLVIKKSMHSANGVLEVIFFKSWESATLNRLSFPDTETFLALGTYPLLSSAGSLALETAQPKVGGYSSYKINGTLFQENSALLENLPISDGKKIPLKLVVRTPVKRTFPVGSLIAISSGVTLLFGGIIVLVFGRWLSRIGARLDLLSEAAIGFHSGLSEGTLDDQLSLLKTANSDYHDEVSVIAQELSELMVVSRKRDEEQRAYLDTLDMLQDAVIEFSPDGRLLHATDAWKVLTGKDDIAQCGIANCVHPEDSADVLEQISALVHHQKQQICIRFRIRGPGSADGHVWVEARFSPVKENDTVLAIRGVVRDITNTYAQERQISHMALHDALTDLPNRVLMEDRLAMAITRAERSNQRVALGFIDLDHFKQVNDTFGHTMGDMLLVEVTKRLQAALRNSDTLSRWGGDEFVVLCPDLNSLQDAREITSKLAALNLENIKIGDAEFPFSFSAGFAVYPDDADNSEKLQSQADRAMFYAKAQGRNNIQFFNAIAAKEHGRQSFYIQSKLAAAINNGEIQAWMQPLVSVRGGKAIGAEVLARWHDKEQGWIPPSTFIPMAESMGIIDKLGQSVWMQALDSFHFLPAGHRLSVNLSKRQLFSSSIVQQFCDDIASAGVLPGQVMLEITEGIALSDVDYARERISELDSRGFGIAVDDFGVGYSSLSQLHEIPVDELKLDMSFVRRIHEPKGLAMAVAIVSIAKSLDLECVAEGVEDAKTAELLKQMGVETLQGYYFSKAMPIGEYIDWLSKPPVDI